MPDSEELDEILKEIKNINAPKEKPEPKEEQPLTLADDKPAKEEAEAKPEASRSTPASTMAIIAEIEGVFTVIPLKMSANWLK